MRKRQHENGLSKSAVERIHGAIRILSDHVLFGVSLIKHVEQPPLEPEAKKRLVPVASQRAG